MTKMEYSKYVTAKSPSSPIVKNTVQAYIIGGIICVIGQLIYNWILSMTSDKDMSTALTSIALIFIGAVLTGLGIYDILAKFGGGGTIIPITGFANSIVAPAMEFKSEGLILGVGAKMFLIAGPVIVYGIVSSFVYGVIIYFMNLV